MHKRFEELLHQFKVDQFHAEHDRRSVEEVTEECMHITEEVLQQKYRYHFHQLPDANRADIINMVNNYTREAILPTVVEKLVMREIKLERRVNALVDLNRKILELLSQEPVAR
jgi:hypothetical protein